MHAINDGYANIVANLGTARDKAASGFYVVHPLSAHDLLDMYRTSWLAGSIVDYPAEDATRNWRFWRADADQIGRIEALEKTLNVKKLVRDAIIAARLYGGAALYINTPDADPSSELTPPRQVISLTLLTNNTLNAGPLNNDITSRYYGQPEYYVLRNSGTSSEVRIHPSRLVIFLGSDIPRDPSTAAMFSTTWADSVLQKTRTAIMQTDSTMANVASLVFEAKIDVFKFKSFAQLLANNQDDVLLRRLNVMAAAKGINGAVTIDSEDDYSQKSASFSGLPDVIARFMDAVAGASRIPVTRLFGRSAAGLSGSGDGDERVYFDRIGDMQSTEIGPAMATLDEMLVHQALGARPPEIYYEWAPLRQLTESERADNFQKTADAARAIAGPNAGALVSLYALSDALVNELTEQGVLPGLDQAVAKYGTLEEENAFEGDDTQQAPMTDAAPRPLYVSRRVLNAREILRHYAAQGLDGLVDAADMHVTITYSRQPVDWFAMGETWQSELRVTEGGPRVMELFGPEKTTLVLSFLSSDLKYRHDRMIEGGASWDWPDYQPHISISYAFDGDVESVQPWTGEIILGPEVFEEIAEP